MSALRAIALVLAGIGAGLCGSVAGLASLVSYPALLAIGLPGKAANATNTIALVFSSMGSITGSRPELVGRRREVQPLVICGVIGGVIGAVVFRLTPGDVFDKLVPWLVAIGALAMLARKKLVEVSLDEEHHHQHGHATHRPKVLLTVGLVGIYAGYFGAGAGVMLLALLLFVTDDSLPRANAVKNVVLGLSNGIAAVTFVFIGDVRWKVVVPLGIGLFIGGRTGPAIVRRSPQNILRVVIAIAGLGLAVKLGLDAY